MDNMSEDNLMVTIRCITYNHAKYIRQCLDGFIMQKTSFRFDVFVHDDASTDGTDLIIKEYAEKYPDIIKPYFETENQYSKHDGSFQRITFNPSYLKGKYIALCEGDDYWIDPDKLQKQVDFLEKNGDYVICCHDFKVYSENNQRFTFDSVYSGIVQFPYSLDLDNYFKGDWIQPLTCIYRNIVSVNELLVNKYKYFRDRVFFYYLLTKGKGCLLPDVMGVYRKHSAGILSGNEPVNNYYIYMSIALQLYANENEPRAFELYKRHALGLLNYQWNKKQKIELFKNLYFIIKRVPIRIAFSIMSTFSKSLLKNKYSALLNKWQLM